MNVFESSAPLEGDRATESIHRKVELQSLDDFTYLYANVSRAAREKLDRDLPPGAVPDGEDVMRKRIERLVDEYIQTTFNAAKDSISINGMDTREMEAELAKVQEGEELDPFDTKLAQRIQTLSSQIESQTLELARLRRNAPQKTAKQFTASFEKQSREYDERLKAAEEASMAAARAAHLDVGRVDRVEEMQGTWQRGNQELRALSEGLGGTVERMEKARRAVEVVEEK